MRCYRTTRTELGRIEHPTFGQILRATHGERGYLHHGECVHSIHLGEDGIEFRLERDRRFNLSDQCQPWRDLADWVIDEIIELEELDDTDLAIDAAHAAAQEAERELAERGCLGCPLCIVRRNLWPNDDFPDPTDVEEMKYA